MATTTSPSEHDLVQRHSLLTRIPLPPSPTLPFLNGWSLPDDFHQSKRNAGDLDTAAGKRQSNGTNGAFPHHAMTGDDASSSEAKRFRLDHPSPSSSSSVSRQASSSNQLSQLFSPADSIGKASPVASDAKSPSFAQGSSSSIAQSGTTRAENAADSRVIFPRERLKKLAASYRDKGRTLKHSSDRIARESSSPDQNSLAILQQMDAVLLYVFAFWCDDQAAKTCVVKNWQSIFGLLTFVKSRAEKSGMAIVVGICLRMEAHIFQTLSNHEQKSLASKGSHLATSSSLPPHPPPAVPRPPPTPSTSTLPPPPRDLLYPLPAPPIPSLAQLPSVFTPPPPTPAVPLVQPTEVVKSFVKASGELFRLQRQWEDSCNLLAPFILSTTLPRTWRLASVINIGNDQGSMIVPIEPFTNFAWPVQPSRKESIPHAVAFCRVLLEEYGQAMSGLAFELADVLE